MKFANKLSLVYANIFIQDNTNAILDFSSWTFQWNLKGHALH